MSDLILQMKNITKEFPGVRALSDVSLEVSRGEIHALCGENGAGKSTLMKVLSGVEPFKSYTGEIFFNNELCQFHGIKDSEEKGIVIIHQELALIPGLSIAENLFIGNEQKFGKTPVIDWMSARKKAQEVLEGVGLSNEDVTKPIGSLGVGKQQLCEIAKALAKDVKLLILDEPTASLNDEESDHLLNIILSLKEKGITSIIISHKLGEITKVADKINECQKLGIKIILVNSDVHNTKKICYVGSDYIKAGKTCAGLLSLISKQPKLDILVVTGSKLMCGHRQRIEGFKEELEALKVDFNICAQIESNDSDITAQIETSKYLKEHQNINCVYVTGAGVQGVGAAIIATNRQDIIGIAFDDIYTTVEMVRAGIFKFVVCQQPDRQGYHAVKRAYQLLSGTVNEQIMTDFYTDTIIKIASNIGK